jgi:hypothetical protein
MNVLDLDIDFFIQNPVYFNKNSLDDNSAYSFPEIDDFLKNKCNLHEQIPGSGVVHHKDIYHILVDKIRNEEIIGPLEWIHIDSHSDLGYCLNDRRQRNNIIDDNNILLKIASLGTINYLVIVKNEKSLWDIDFSLILTEKNKNNISIYASDCKKLIPFSQVSASKFCYKGHFDYMFLSKSLNYSLYDCCHIYEYIQQKYIRS